LTNPDSAERFIFQRALLKLPETVCFKTADLAGCRIKITWPAEHPGFQASIHI